MASALGRLVAWMRGHGCEKLIKYTGKEIEISGLGVQGGTVKLDIGKYKSKMKVFQKANELARALDDSQYLLCTTAAWMESSDPLKQQTNRIRIMIILGITQLRTLLAAPKQKGIGRKLAEWVGYMNRLNISAIEMIMSIPEPRIYGRRMFRLSPELEKKIKEAVGPLITPQLAISLEPKKYRFGYVPDLSHIMKYQRITERELESAEKLLS